jgi:hypothetical protein
MKIVLAGFALLTMMACTMESAPASDEETIGASTAALEDKASRDTLVHATIFDHYVQTGATSILHEQGADIPGPHVGPGDPVEKKAR